MMWHALAKTGIRFAQQVQMLGYRLDFVIFLDGEVALEIDGAQYHDPKRDARRDEQLLRSGRLAEIIRIPAAAVLYFRDATMKVLSKWHPGLRSPEFVFMPERAMQEANQIIASLPFVGEAESREAAYHFAYGEAASVTEKQAVVGSPLSMVDSSHEIWRLVDHNQINLHRTQQTITRRTSATWNR